MQIISMLSIFNISLKRLQEKQLCLLYPAMNSIPSYQVRPMTGDDLDAVVVIEAESYASPWQYEHFQNELTAPYSWPFVAVEETCVIGYVCLMSLFEEAQILNITVAPDRRGRGVAKMLMEKAVSRALEEGAEVMALEVRASNISAISLYEQFGFKQIGIRARYYDGTEDAILMEKIVKENP